jgi:hypothetical protein
VFKRGQELAWVQLSVWDSEKDAIEYAGAFAKTVKSRMPGFTRQPVTEQPRIIWKNKPGRVVYVERRGNKVLVVENLEAPIADKIGKAGLPAGP